jgi:superfamily II DNA or RNA helicase
MRAGGSAAVTTIVTTLVALKVDALLDLADGSHGEIERLLAMAALVAAHFSQLFARVLQQPERPLQPAFGLRRGHAQLQTRHCESEQSGSDERGEVPSIHVRSPVLVFWRTHGHESCSPVHVATVACPAILTPSRRHSGGVASLPKAGSPPRVRVWHEARVRLVYLPDVEALFLWDSDGTHDGLPQELLELASSGEAHSATLVTPQGRREVPGRKLALLETVSRLALLPSATLEALPASVASWALASKLALDLVARERIVPSIARQQGRMQARWAAALSASEDSARVAALARSLPPAAHAVPAQPGEALDVWAPDALVRAYVDAVVDALVRASRGAPGLPQRKVPPRERPRGTGGSTAPALWDQRWRAALDGPEPAFEPRGFAERSLAEALERWSEPALGARDRLRACFQLELPAADRQPFVLRFLLQSPEDPSLLVPAAEVWQAAGRSLEKLGRAFRDPQESLLEALGRAARLFAPVEGALSSATPQSIELDPGVAWSFLSEGAALLAEAGFGVIVPGELTAAGQRRLRLRARVGGKQKTAGAVSGAAGLGLEELLAVDWQAVIGDQALSARELEALAKQKAPLVQFRGAWVAVDPRELAEIRARLAAGPTELTLREAVQAALAGETRQGSLSAVVSATGGFAELLERLRQSADLDLSAPASLQATLRPYQERGLGWLSTLGSLGLGACLADDMGLGKTIQLLALLLRQREHAPAETRPALLIAPTSVIGNWEREAQRFAPTLPLCAHYGAERARSAEDLAGRAGSLVLSTYGVLRRDAELLSRVDWSLIALDEAQNIKNAASATARAARGLRASQRFALTGTPIENRLAELWSILEFANPGLLGPLEKFRREFAIPIERYANDSVAQRLRRIVSPFVLRRLKSDPAIVADLPAKNEMRVVCSLTREQASLYKAVVDAELRRIEHSEGMERRGRVLALLTFTKQICNHPAQYLSESGPLAGRSGKLERISEMLEEALAAGDKALVFSQFREMGARLVEHLRARLGVEVLFLHGGTAKATRDELVQRFQHEPGAARVFVLSLKAGGTGLNLTAANHVFHYDRWWNPAVEDQATDRAYRIGQQRAVQVHKLVSAGTVEEKIDLLLEQKRKLASKIVGSSERWITELEASELRSLFALSAGAGVGLDDSDGGDAAPDGADDSSATAKAKRKRSRSREARP